MIRYPTTLAELEAAVDTEKPNWRSRAARRTQRFRNAGGYFEPPKPIWSEIKAVYMRLQHNKCAFCELQEGDRQHGRIKVDVEHFRPKREVEAWPPPGHSKEGSYDFPTGEDLAGGYYLLAYSILNYAASCKSCNSNLKAVYFPIEGARVVEETDPHCLAAERPLPIYPIGDTDTDPEELIGFLGVIPVPLVNSGYNLHRAWITIDLFELDIREELLRDRCGVIAALNLAFRLVECGSIEDQAVGWQHIERATSPTSPHTSMARCFRRLWEANPEEAKQVANEANHTLNRILGLPA